MPEGKVGHASLATDGKAAPLLANWRLTYGALLVILLIAGVVASGMGAGALWQTMQANLPRFLFFGVAITLGLTVLFTGLEYLLPAPAPRKPLKGYLLILNIWLVGQVTGVALFAVVAISTTTLGNVLGLGWIDLRFSTGHGVWALIAAFLLAQFLREFFFYWFHRFQHESPVLWQEHKLHHMDEQVCAATTLRQHWLDNFLLGFATGLPLAILFKLDPEQSLIAVSLAVTWATFTHSNIRLHLGPANALLGGPQQHRIHHSRLAQHHNRNYAAFFPIWDVLFGTYYHPARDEYPMTGVDGETEVPGIKAAATLPFREWLAMFRAWRGTGPVLRRTP